MGYLNGLNLKVSESKYVGYSIKFDLEFRRGGTIEESEQKAQKEKIAGYSVGNRFSKGNSNIYSRFATKEIDNGDGTTTTSTVGGVIVGNNDIMMNTTQDTKMNRVHEIFHTFGFTHPKGIGGKEGIMQYPPQKPNQNDADQLINNDFLPKVMGVNVID